MKVCDFDSQVQSDELNVGQYLTTEQWSELDVHEMTFAERWERFEDSFEFVGEPDIEPYGVEPMKSVKQRIEECESDNARELLLGLYSALADAIEIPNNMLSPEFRTKKGDGRSVSELEKLMTKSTEVDDDSYEAVCMAKKIRLDSYCDQEHDEANCLRYCEDERRLNNAQIKFLNTMVKLGVIEADELRD